MKQYKMLRMREIEARLTQLKKKCSVSLLIFYPWINKGCVLSEQ